LDAPHFIQVGDVPVFSGAGSDELICRCGGSILIKGYLPRNFLAIRIKCFRCGAVTTTPGLPAGEVLPRDAVAIAPREMPAVTPIPVPFGAMLACEEAIAREYALTRPRDPPSEPMVLSPAMLDATAALYDRLTGGRLVEHCAATPAAMASRQGDHPFAWSLLRLREQIGKPDWSWRYHNDDAMAAMYVAALHHLEDCWGQHPLLARLASPLGEPGRFLHTLTSLAAAKLLFDAGNRVGFSLPASGQTDVQLHFSTGAGDALSLALRAPNALQWRERDRRSPQVLHAAVADAVVSAQGQVNARNPGIVMLSVSILQPDFDQALVDSIHAVFRATGRKHRGVAAIAVIMPKVLPVGRPDQVGFGYAFYPIRNPHFAGENPIRLGTDEDFNAEFSPA
jgi:hypothetical protein